MEVANAGGFVFKRRRKEEASTSSPPPTKVHQVDENYQYMQRQGVRVEEECVQVYGMRQSQDKPSSASRRTRRSSIIQEETNFPPYPVGGAVILPTDGEESSVGEGEKLLKLCHEIAATECRNVSRTFVGKAEEVSHLVYNALQGFENSVRTLVQDGNIKFLSKESRDLNAKKQTMQRLVESLESELKSWSEVKEAEQKQDQSQNHQELFQEKEEEGRRDVKEHSAEGKLASAYNDTLSKIDIKVNNLCGLVTSVESLCGQTEKYTKELQTKYHKQIFNPLPHVNSPAALIKSLLKPTV
jgi:hypothetical protein